MSDTHDVLDLSSKANRLELLDKAKNVRYDPIELNNALIDQLEHTRKYLGVSQTYFAELLGVTKENDQALSTAISSCGYTDYILQIIWF